MKTIHLVVHYRDDYFPLLRSFAQRLVKLGKHPSVLRCTATKLI